MNAKPEILNIGDNGVRDFMRAGSRVTCNPEPTGTDQDWIVLVDSHKWDEFSERLISCGWAIGGSNIPMEGNTLPEDKRFSSFVLQDDNIIATQSPDFYKRFLAATAVCANLNLLEKQDRIDLFQAVLYSATANPEYRREWL